MEKTDLETENQEFHVFVYGTLKPGEANYARYCSQRVIKTCRAIAFGQLYALPFGYPGMTAGDRPIYGFLLSFSDLQVLRDLDTLENYDPQRPATENEYQREKVEVFDLNLQPLGWAWIYRMLPEQPGQLGGIWLSEGVWTGKLPSV